MWNEPNLTVFWEGADQAAYHRLYEVTARAVKDVDASLQVGGPVLSPGSDEWWAPFADFVAARDVPIDFVSRHAYSSGPVQQVPFGVYQTFERPQELLDQFDAPRRHLEGTALAGLPVHISEFNTSYRPDNPVHDTAWNAAYLAPVLAGGGDLVDSFSYWTFCDVFEEADIPTVAVPRRLRAADPPPGPQADLPPVRVHGPHGSLGAGARRGPPRVPRRRRSRDGPGVAAGGGFRRRPLRLRARDATRSGCGCPSRRTWRSSGARVNETEGNAWTAWRELGRPRNPSERVLDLLRDASAPAVRHYSLAAVDGHVDLDLVLGQHEVTLVELAAGDARRAPGAGRQAAARAGRGGMTAMATKPDDEIGTGALSRWSAVVYWFLVVEGMLVLTSAPGLVLLLLLDRDASNLPLVALACVPFGPSVAAAALRVAGVRPGP